MRRMMMLLVVFVCGLGMIACSSEPEGGEEENTGQNNQNQHPEDVGVGGDTDVGEEDVGDEEEDACIPQTECPASKCGQIDDGCGGTLDCGECGCVDGQPQQTSCGDCGLGILSCEDGETGSGVCDAPEIPGFDGACDELVFVSQREGSDTGLGTKDDPVNTLEAGLSVARSSNAAGVILGGGSGVEYEGPVLIEERTSIIGGYDDELVRDVEKEPVITSDTAPEGFEDGDVVGVAVRGVSQSVILSNFDVETGDVEAYGRNNYGMYVKGSPGLSVENVEVVAGRGGDGRDGENGAQGARGDDGADAMEEIEFSWDGEEDVSQSDFQEGFGGENSECPDAAGGDGGYGEMLEYTDGESTRAHATDGGDALVARGGVRGEHMGELGDAAGEDGEDGPSVTPSAADGIGGNAGGEVVEGLWSPGGVGTDGEEGEDGNGGGGGGGAGAHEAWGADRPTPGSSFGGGGGAGGCGGEGGEGGGAGGASFGVFVLDGDIEVASSGFFANIGGAGGTGGAGGVGGQGGRGGAPTYYGTTDEHDYVWEYDEGELGGYGGDGSAGSNGGGGGGGAGGASFGGYCRGAEISPSGTVRFNDAGSSSGGIGGSGGSDGDAGVSVDEDGCL